MKSTLAIVAISAVLLSGLVFMPGVKMNAFSLSSTQSQGQLTLADLNFNLGPGFIPVTSSSPSSSSSDAKTVNVTFVAYETNVTLPSGQVVQAETWNGTIPGPTVRVTQGDVLNVHIINHPNNKLIHSLDHHAATISAVPNFGPINVSKSKDYSFVATMPGAFKYHCEGNAVLGMDQHVFQGMVGTVIVDPKEGYTGYTTTGVKNGTTELTNIDVAPDAKEVLLQFSEYYLNKDGGYDADAMFHHFPTASWINGIPFGYDPVITKTPNATVLQGQPGDHFRFFVMNHGDLPLNFHIVGEMLDRVSEHGQVNSMGDQTTLVGGSDDATVDVYFDHPGVYAIVNHDYSQLFKGQAGLIVIDTPNGPLHKALGLKDSLNPSNAIPPAGPNTIPVDTKPYMLGHPLNMTAQ